MWVYGELEFGRFWKMYVLFFIFLCPGVSFFALFLVCAIIGSPLFRLFIFLLYILRIYTPFFNEYRNLNILDAALFFNFSKIKKSKNVID